MKQALTKEMLESVVFGGQDFDLDVCYTTEDVFSYLENVGWERGWKYETSGYQVDWWETFHKGNVTLELSGCMWYGGLQGMFSQ